MTWTYVEGSDELSQEGAVEEIYGYSKSEFQQNKKLWYEVIYPEDRKYLDLATESLDLKNNQETSVQYRITHKEGYAKNVLGSIKIEERDGCIVYSGYIIDISSHNEAIIGEDYHENLIVLLKESLHTLYNSDERRDSRVCFLLKQFSELMSVGRVILYKKITSSGEGLNFKVSHKWVGKNVVKSSSNDSSAEYLKFGEDYVRWYKIFVEQKAPVNEIVRLLPETERETFYKEGVKSILAVPIWLESEFYGFIRFDDFKSERYWSRENIRVLSIFGALIASSSKYEKSKEAIRANVEQLKKMQEEREQLLKMLSHQFKTPLSIIELNVRMLERVEKQLNVDAGKKYRKKIERILRAVESTKELIEAIMIGESYKTADSVPEKLNIYKTVEKLVDKTRRALEGDLDITYKTICKSSVITLPFKQKTFEYIFDAVVSNAIKYSGQDIPKVEIEVKVEDDYFLLGVLDYGIGIHEEDLDKIGTTFYRGGNVGDIPGSGIGLSMIKETVKEVDGSIEIKSKLGEFTKVLLGIPLAEPNRHSE